MKKVTKLFALILVAVMILSVFSGCGTKNGNNVSSTDSFTYWVPLDTSSSQTMQSFNEHYMYMQMEKLTGKKIEFIHPSAGNTGAEAFQILLASGDYPDLIEFYWNEYPGGGDQAIKDGVIIKLNDYLEKYAPNYYNYMEGDAGKASGFIYKADTISYEGNYYGFKTLHLGKYRANSGLYVRKDLLEKWNLDIPTTLDDWEVIFETAKKEGIKYPLTGRSTLVGAYGSNLFNNAYNIGNTFYVDGNTIKFGPFEKEYKNYIKKMAEWMKKGYIDPDYVTNDTTMVQGRICNGTSIASMGYVGSDLGYIIPAMSDRQPGFDLVACPAPVMKEGDTPRFQPVQALAADPTLVISVQCGETDENRYKEAIKWCDFLYSDEGIILKSFGVEGETYTVEKDNDGNEHYVYTDKIKNWKNIAGANSIEGAIYHYTLPANHPGFGQHHDYFDGYYEYSQQKDAIQTWNKYVKEAEKYVLPNLTYTGDEAAEQANILAKGKDNLVASISNIILGKASIDTLDIAIAQAKKDGYDRLLEITQAAYDRYISVTK